MASNPLKTADPIRFAGDFELDLSAYELRRSGRPLKLERIPLELLLMLIEHRGELVTREQIIERIWGKDVFLDTESGINGAIRKIRQALKDDPEELGSLRNRRTGLKCLRRVSQRWSLPTDQTGISFPGYWLRSA